MKKVNTRQFNRDQVTPDENAQEFSEFEYDMLKR